DRGEKYDPEHLGIKLLQDDIENDRYIEIWNNVFSQYNATPGLDRKDYPELPSKNIDTGMGLERMLAILQEVDTNFDTDIFMPIIHKIEEISGRTYNHEPSFKIIADHIRAITFALADGANFGNNGRDYVLRRLLRRAVRHGKKLGIENTFMKDLVPVVVDIMNFHYPYLNDKMDMIMGKVDAEEKLFSKTLLNGEKKLQEIFEISKNKEISGEDAFKLYDTYGFPFELTQEIAEESGISVSRDEFDAEMNKQKERARNARNVKDSFASQNEELMNFNEPSEFIGYDHLSCDGKIIALFNAEGKMVDSLEDEGMIILDETCFYAESGGQVADKGVFTADGVEVEVLDVQKTRNKQHIHTVKINSGVLEKGMSLYGEVNVKDRLATTANHSCTHLLQSALVKVLGDHIHQAGSYNCPEYLRFDFNHYEKVTAEQLAEVERIVNEYISAAYPVTKEVMPIEEAKRSGATALFDEKYGDTVRVVTMGDVSKEFCAGCHVENTAQIGLCKIISEESIGSDSRRITAKTKFAAYQDFAQEHNMLENIADSAKQKGIKNIDTKVEAAYKTMSDMQKEIDNLKNQIFTLKSKEWATEAKDFGKVNVLIKSVSGMDAGALKDIVSNLKASDDKMVVFFVNTNGEKAVFVSGAGKEAVKAGVHAGQLVKKAAQICSGNGGGKPDMAQAGGKDASKVDEAINAITEELKSL
ncbi:MAG TPA: alanine--tRNA ligase, partial [Erysipelotrichaceae bacterium]|nr:alanine--tRNA ligase [Erysipelotrichaceae bacterium]